MPATQEQVRRERRPVCSLGNIRKGKVWDIYREVESNRRDADPTSLPTDISADGSILTCFTKTYPKYIEIVSIGEGSKNAGEDSIGQFGEGIKFAVVTAIREGMTVTILTPECEVTFETELEEGARFPTLFAIKGPPPKDQVGCVFVIRATPGTFGSDLSTRFLPQGISGASNLIQRDKPGPTNLFCKGVHVCRLETHGLHDYNLNDLTLNRDRSMPDLRTALILALPLSSGWSDDDLELILQCEEDVQTELAILRSSSYGLSTSLKDRFTSAFHRVWGENAMIASSRNKRNEIAISRGKRPVILKDLISLWCVVSLCPRVDDFVADVGGKPKRVSTNPQHARRMRRAIELSLGDDCMELIAIRYFQDGSETEDGRRIEPQVVKEGGRIVLWLPASTEDLPTPRDYSTMFGLLSQMGNCSDLQLGDAVCAADFAGRLAAKLLSRRKGGGQ